MDLPDYLEPDFNPWKATAARLRSILLEHAVSHRSHAKKGELVDLFNANVWSHADDLRATRATVQRTTEGIQDAVPGIMNVATAQQAALREPRRNAKVTTSNELGRFKTLESQTFIEVPHLAPHRERFDTVNDDCTPSRNMDGQAKDKSKTVHPHEHNSTANHFNGEAPSSDSIEIRCVFPETPHRTKPAHQYFHNENDSTASTASILNIDEGADQSQTLGDSKRSLKVRHLVPLTTLADRRIWLNSFHAEMEARAAYLRDVQQHDFEVGSEWHSYMATLRELLSKMQTELEQISCNISDSVLVL